MKIDITVSVELRDWLKAGKLTMKVLSGEMEAEDGTKFSISQSVGGLHIMVNQEDTHREAIADLKPLVEAMADALVKHGTEIDG